MSNRPRNPRRRPYGRSVVLLALAVLASAPAWAQISPVPGINHPYFFDDFHYPGTVSTGFDPGSSPYPAGFVMGPNDWFVAGSPSQQMSTTNSRGWFHYSWMEFGGNGRPMGYTAAEPCDTTWFEPCGVFLTSESAIVNGTYPKLAQLDTGARAYDPSLLLFQANPGTYNNNASLRISSGLAAQTGTWVARVLLPDFDGLEHHDPIGGTPVDQALTMYPAFWLQSAEFHVDTRANVFPDNSDKTWSEVNFEINNWFDPDAGNGHKAISSGITWANNFMANRTENPRMGTSGSEGKCYIIDDSGSGRWGSTNPRECFEILTGKQHGPLFITLYFVISETNVNYYILAWDEDLHHVRGNFYPGFDFLMMQSIDTFRHHAPPRILRTLFDLNIKSGQEPTGELQETKDMLIDWVYYTPQLLSPTSSPSIYSLPATVRNIRDHLWQQYNSSRSPSQQIWRINTTGLPIDRGVDPSNDSPCLSYPGNGRAPKYDFEVDIQPFWNGSRLFFSPETRVDFSGNPGHFTRQVEYSVEWKIYEVLYGGSRSLRHQVIDKGYVYELPGYLVNGDNPVDVEVTVRERDENGQVCGTHTDSYRYTPTCGQGGALCGSGADCCSGYCDFYGYCN